MTTQAALARACGNVPEGDYEVLLDCLCDDPNGTGELIGYTAANIVYLGPGGIVGEQFVGYFTDETLCEPYVPVNPVSCDQPGRIRQFTADSIDLEGLGWDSVSILTPECCGDDLVVITNLGEFRLPPGVCGFSPDAFENRNNLITSLEIVAGPLGSNCDPRLIAINVQYKGRAKREVCG